MLKKISCEEMCKFEHPYLAHAYASENYNFNFIDLDLEENKAIGNVTISQSPILPFHLSQTLATLIASQLAYIYTSLSHNFLGNIRLLSSSYECNEIIHEKTFNVIFHSHYNKFNVEKKSAVISGVFNFNEGKHFMNMKALYMAK